MRTSLVTALGVLVVGSSTLIAAVASPDGPINEVDPATIEIGQPVRVVFQRVADDVTLPRWMLAS